MVWKFMGRNRSKKNRLWKIADDGALFTKLQTCDYKNLQFVICNFRTPERGGVFRQGRKLNTQRRDAEPQSTI
jgi:hypothetical protein